MIKFTFCPQDKSQLDNSGDYPKCPTCKTVFYRNSKPCAGILPIKNGQVLLSKRAIEPYLGAYDIIGGFLNEGEHPEAGALREAKEESGLDLKITKLLGMYIDRYGEGGEYTLNIHYLADVTGGSVNAQEDVASLHWVDIDKVPLDEGFENTKKALSDLKKLFSK